MSRRGKEDQPDLVPVSQDAMLGIIRFYGKNHAEDHSLDGFMNLLSEVQRKAADLGIESRIEPKDLDRLLKNPGE